jgi:hypothetical protein
MLFPKKHQYGDTDTIFLIKIKTTQNLSVLALIEGLGYTVQGLNRPNTLLGRIQSPKSA